MSSGWRWILCLLWLSCSAPPAGADTVPELPWQSLKFEARKLFAHGEFQVALSPLPAREALEFLQPADQQALPLAGPLWRLDGEMSLLGNRAVLRLLMDARDLHSYHRWRLTEGSERRLKTTRFLQEAALWRRQEPDASSSRPAQWPVVREKRIPYPLDSGGNWLDAVSLLVVVSGAQLRQPGDRLTVMVFTDQQPYRVTLEVLDTGEIPVDFRLHRESAGQTISGKRRALEIAIRHTPLVPLEDEPEFNVLGLTGDIRIFVDTEHRLPVQLEGEADSRGRLVVKLKEARLSPQ